MSSRQALLLFPVGHHSAALSTSLCVPYMRSSWLQVEEKLLQEMLKRAEQEEREGGGCAEAGADEGAGPPEQRPRGATAEDAT